MTATKAIAGGVAANIVTVVLWAISNVPGWNAVPEQPKAAIIALVSAGVGAVIVYFAPANKETSSTEPEKRPESNGAFQTAGLVARTAE